MEYLDNAIALGKVALAMGLGGIIGFERERATKPAGLRTHMFVAGGAALLVLIGTSMVEQAMSKDIPGAIRSDPLRMMQSIVMAVGFICAGSIFFQPSESRLRGLTTAAGILVAGAVGMAVGIEEYLLAVGVTIITLIILHGLNYIEKRYLGKEKD